MSAMSPYFRAGRGKVPSAPLMGAAWKELLELPGAASTGASANGLGSQLDFTMEGLAPATVKDFFEEALSLNKSMEAVVESGNKYGVSIDFESLNGEILMHTIKSSSAYQALSTEDQFRAEEIFSIMCFNPKLRNRNPLHPSPLDSAVLGNLINFPKHIFGFPMGGYSTNGNEALSLCLYSYRQLCSSTAPLVLYVLASGESSPPPELRGCCARLRMDLRIVEEDLMSKPLAESPAVILASFGNASLGAVCSWAARAGSSVHVHVSDREFRSIFAENPEPVHFQLPEGVRSMSLQEGLFCQGYQLHRDAHLRDLYMDLPYGWQTSYVSPNEGGSGNSTPLFVDFCFTTLGWSALRDMAMHGAPGCALMGFSETLQPLTLGPYEAEVLMRAPHEAGTFDEVLTWAKASMDLPREVLEKQAVTFQRNFVGGKTREVEAIVTAGGTRSGNMAFESVISRAGKALTKGAHLKVIAGNPHLLVERAERRYQFQLVRAENEGMLCVEKLKREIQDPMVVAIYAQTLGITDGTSDPLEAILEVVEAENQRRQANGGMLVTFINDCCLSLSVLIHNDGQDGRRNMRVLEMVEGCITPAIVMLDAHKHLGADKGISMVMGTTGTLSHLSGNVRVGAAPSRGELVRAIADMSLMGVNGYYEKYHSLASAVENLIQKLDAAGMAVIRRPHRVRGSTVFAVEDPRAVVGKLLKKRNQFVSPLFQYQPDKPDRCQSGWLLSLTPNSMRHINGRPALDIFADDAVACHRLAAAKVPKVATLFSEDSLPAMLLAGGNEEFWALAQLMQPGVKREVVSLSLRRVYSMILDGGVVCSENRSPLRVVSSSAAAAASAAALVALRAYRRRSKL